MYHPYGEMYSGEVRDGRMHGRGRYTYRNGDVFQGTWHAQRPAQGCLPAQWNHG